ncbi:hypothetical protein F4679DRAFT_568239 [Xylaria curta]|nr:hypothetical protein F4679DRAFT_568239 [Xylaria curta]
MDIEDAVNWVLLQRLEDTREDDLQYINIPGYLRNRNPRPRQPILNLLQPRPVLNDRLKFVQYRDRSPEAVKATKKDLTRDERLEIRVLKKHFPDLTYLNLMDRTGASRKQVQNALNGPLTPKKKGRGGLKLLTNTQKHALLQFLYAHDHHREIPWRDLRLLVPEIASFGEVSMSRIMTDLGFKRRKRGTTRLDLLDEDHRARAAFAADCLRRWPTLEAWMNYGPIFSDETYATTKPVHDRWITVHDCEDPMTFELLRTQDFNAWMFWGQI